MFIYTKRYMHKCINSNICNADSHAYVNKVCNDMHKNPNTSHQALRISFNHIGVHFDCYEENGQLGEYCNVSVCDCKNLSMHWWCLYGVMFLLKEFCMHVVYLRLSRKNHIQTYLHMHSNSNSCLDIFTQQIEIKIETTLDNAYLIYSYLLICLHHHDPLSPLMSFTLLCVFSYALLKCINISLRMYI